MLDKELLEILVCPKTHQPLRLAEADLVARINDGILTQRLKNVGGRLLETVLDGGLVSPAAGLLYPILDGIPVLLADEAIPLDQLDA